MNASRKTQSIYHTFIFGLCSVLGYLALIVVVPFYGLQMIWKKKYRYGVRQRLTLYTKEEIQRFIAGKHIWIHAVSVGELQAARPLLKRLKLDYPDHELLVTTVTYTGQGLANSMAEIDHALYFPLDVYPLCRRFLTMVQPVFVVIMETELWPNMIWAVTDRSIPVVLVNARLSDRSFNRYLKVRWFFYPILQRLSAILTQSETDTQRFVQFGADPGRVQWAGNLKFEAAPSIDESMRAIWRDRFQITDDELLIVAGSTFPQEEEALARVCSRVKNVDPSVRLLIAPRHIDRSSMIVQTLSSMGFQVCQRSKMEAVALYKLKECIILLDTIGELMNVYAAADIVFIGKSLYDRGGQNPIEPGAWGKPIVFGEHMENFKAIAELFLKSGAAVKIADEDELYITFIDLVQSESTRNEMGEQAKSIIAANQGTLDRIMQVLAPIFPNESNEKSIHA